MAQSAYRETEATARCLALKNTRRSELPQLHQQSRTRRAVATRLLLDRASLFILNFFVCSSLLIVWIPVQIVDISTETEAYRVDNFSNKSSSKKKLIQGFSYRDAYKVQNQHTFNLSQLKGINAIAMQVIVMYSYHGHQYQRTHNQTGQPSRKENNNRSG